MRPLARVLLAMGVATASVLVGGVGTATAQRVTSPAVEAITDWAQVDAGTIHTCGVTEAHRAYCWGSDGLGALGNGAPRGARTVPDEVSGGATNWAAVSAGELTTCGLKTTGRLFCWGSDSLGQRGDGNGRVNSTVPRQVAGGHTDWTAVSVGTLTTCGIRAGRLFCWGADTYGALANGGADVSRNAPVEVFGGATNWQSVSVGLFGACARKTTGRLLCWGDDRDGAVGAGDNPVARGRPNPVANGEATWQVVGAGLKHRCATRTTGRLFCWGDNPEGQLGLPGQNPVDTNFPSEVSGNQTDWASVVGGASFSCGLTNGHTVRCWGDNFYRQLGNNSAQPFAATPVAVAGGISDWASLTAGDGHACAIRAGGALYCWGRGDYGQLGIGPLSVSPVAPVPTQVAP